MAPLTLISRGHTPAARLTSAPAGGVVCAGSGGAVEASSPRRSISARTLLTPRDITVTLLRKPGVWKWNAWYVYTRFVVSDIAMREALLRRGSRRAASVHSRIRVSI